MVTTTFMQIERKARKQKRIKNILKFTFNSVATLCISGVIAVLIGGMI